MKKSNQVPNTLGDRLEIRNSAVFEKLNQARLELKKKEYNRVTFTQVQRRQIKEYCLALGYEVTFNKENKCAKIIAHYDVEQESPAGNFYKRIQRNGFVSHKEKGFLEYGYFKKTNWIPKYSVDNEIKMFIFLKNMFGGQLLKAFSIEALRVICGLPELELNINQA